MVDATVVSLVARPYQAVQLCFEVGGILETLTAQLGTPVTAFPFSTFYSGLYPTPGVTAKASLLNSQQLLATAALTSPAPGPILASLRAEPRKAALDRAVNLRQNAYNAKYGPTPSANISNFANQIYAAGSVGSPTNPWMLGQLQLLSQIQASQLASTYNSTGRGWPGWTGSVPTPPSAPGGPPYVVQNTTSTLTAKTYTTDTSTATPDLTTTTTPDLTTTTTGQSNQEQIEGGNFGQVSLGSTWGTGGAMGTPPPAGGTFGYWISGNAEESLQEGTSGETATQTGTSTATETGTEKSTGDAYAVETEQIINTDYTYRVPFVESQAQGLRAQISLNNEQFALLMATQNLTNLSTTLQTELNSIDLSVYQLQVGLLNTLLLPSISGTVTGIYKYPGDPVRAGEPIIRIENNSQMLLVARLLCPGPINVSTSTMTITTSQLFDSTALAQPIIGTVIAARGAGDDDLWDVVVQIPNPSPGDPVLPINYNFDYDDTTVTIT